MTVRELLDAINRECKTEEDLDAEIDVYSSGKTDDIRKLLEESEADGSDYCIDNYSEIYELSGSPDRGFHLEIEEIKY